jgi:hypothetical protein
MPASCKYCGARVIWAKTSKGKLMPMDASPVDEGEWALDFQGDTSKPPRAHRAEAGTQLRYQTHWATCPSSKKARAEAQRRREGG